MKKIFAILSVVAALSLTGCANDFLDTDPTDRVSGTLVFSNAENALSAMNGLYRELNLYGWGSSWAHENGGLPAYILVMDLKAEDHLMDGSGSGWFYYDFVYDTFGDYTGTAGHQHQIWNFLYTLICGTNYILDYKEMDGTADDVNYVVGQAFALRSFCYMWLIQAYQQNGGAANSATRSLPGVPLYTEPTVAGSAGKGRGTVQDVYDQANADIDSAIARLGATNVAKKHPSHIDLAVAYAFKARHALVQQDYTTALAAAEEAMKGQQLGGASDIAHINNADAKNVMWGLKVQTDQAIGNADIYTHMDADCLSTYSKARHLIVKKLYDMIPATDVRKAWWTAEIPEASWGTAGTATGSNRSWCQKKLVFTNAASSLGDHVFLRTEEVYLIAAEAACKLEDYTKARTYLGALGALRQDDYATRLATFTDSNVLNADTYAAPVTLMDEIQFQRRVELWGENPRIFDILRLGLCFDRANGGNFTSKQYCTAYTSKVASANFILWIPRSEFDGNENMDEATDQNTEQGKNL